MGEIPIANACAFQNGWFRTGDQGFLDEDGHLRVPVRLKEIINRGGEKISPREVDEVLMDHPGVAQAVTFAVPHDRLGEDVAAAIVLSEGVSVTDRDLKQFASDRLAAFKVPRKFVILAEIPKGPTGSFSASAWPVYSPTPWLTHDVSVMTAYATPRSRRGDRVKILVWDGLTKRGRDGHSEPGRGAGAARE